MSQVGAPVVTRFAPSPTGFLHLGSARTALFNWLYARKHQGKFLLRIEDTDEARSSEIYEKKVLSALQWLGLQWDDMPVIQSQRKARHQEVAYQLLQEGKAYRCYCTPQELEAMREAAAAEGRPPVYDRRWRHGGEVPPPNLPFVVRLKMPLEGETVLEDLVQGRVTVQNSQLDDMIILRSDGSPTYMLAVVVDDHDMHVSHIFRGSDHLMNAFRQTPLYKAMGWPIPLMGHIPLIHGEDGGKLSKRHGAVNVEDYAQQGILPEALLNTLLRLGWSHGDDEKISTAQALAWFDIKGLGKTAACFDGHKLLALNSHYLRLLSPEEVLATPFVQERWSLEGEVRDKALAILPSLQQRAKTLQDIVEVLPIYTAPLLPEPLAPELEEKILPQEQVLAAFVEDFAPYEEAWHGPELETALRGWAQGRNLPFGQLAQPLRIVLTGKSVSPGVFEVMEVLGKAWTLQRIEAFLHRRKPS